MSLIEKINPVGLDTEIAMHNSYMHRKLGFDADHQAYPRVYVMEEQFEHGKGLVPRHFVSGVDYKEVLFNDQFNLSSFYYRHPVTKHNDFKGAVRVSLIVQAQLDKLFPGAPHRFDEELNAMYEELGVKYAGHDSFKLMKTVTTIEEVYQDFYIDNLTNDDIHPFYVMRQEYLVRYMPGKKC